MFNEEIMRRNTDPLAVINVLDVIDLKMSIQIIHKYLK